MNSKSVPAVVQGTGFGRFASNALIGFGVLFLVASMVFTGHSLLKSWLIGQDHYLVAGDVAPLPVATMNWMASVKLSATPWPTATPRPNTIPQLASSAAVTTSAPTISPSPTVTHILASTGTAVSVLRDAPLPTFAAAATVLPSPTATLAPAPAVASPPPPVKIRIPALDINRSIIHLARESDGSTEMQTWNTKNLFRTGRKDLVGHSEGSAYPGEKGNMILVGHNQGNGYSGVFARLKKLKPGRKVYVVNSAGETFAYEVKTKKKVKWQRENFGELTQHLSYLSPGGSERLTLVSCSGANVAPFPERIYVVAEPVE